MDFCNIANGLFTVSACDLRQSLLYRPPQVAVQPLLLCNPLCLKNIAFASVERREHEINAVLHWTFVLPRLPQRPVIINTCGDVPTWLFSRAFNTWVLPPNFCKSLRHNLHDTYCTDAGSGFCSQSRFGNSLSLEVLPIKTWPKKSL